MKNIIGKLKDAKEPPKKKTTKVTAVVPDETLDLEQSLVKSINEMLESSNGTFWKQSNSFAPSNSNQCPRFAVYRFRGYQQRNDILGQTRRIFDLGNRIEDAVQAMFYDLGILIDSQVELDISEPVPVRGYIDFIIDWDGEKPVECKSINEAGFAYRKAYHKPKDEHFRQLQFYLFGKGYDSGFLFYYSKNNSEILPLLVKRDDKFLDTILKKYSKIYDVYKNGDIPKRPYKQSSQNCSRCDAFQHCWTDTEVGVDIPSGNK